MKLSEAIMLGSLSVPQGSGNESLFSDNSRCALGAARLAMGLTGKGEVNAYRELTDLWPWIGNDEECPRCHREGTARAIIWHLNDVHSWPRERIASWVASIEPATPEPTEGRDPEQTHQELCVVEEKV